MPAMKRALVCIAIGLGLAAAPVAVASPTLRLSIVHVLHGCHAWGTSDSQPLGPARTVTIQRGGKLTIRVNCPMSFSVAQLAGPTIGVSALWQPGTSQLLTFAKRGVYRFQATSTTSSEAMGLQTLGPDNVLVLTVRVR